MPIYQETHRREDTVQRRMPAPDDIEFLKELQRELNTQDAMCQADPRFWVIAQTEWRETAQDDAETSWLVDEEGNELKTLDDVRDWLDLQRVPVRMDGDVLEYDDHGAEIRFTAFDSIVEHIDEGSPWMWPFDGVRVVHMRSYTKIMPDVLFLAHADAEAHLREFGYRYASDAHAYAMTALNSPRFARLIKLLQELDFDAVRAAADIGTGVHGA